MISITAVHHVSLVVDDLARARWFYGTVLGLEERARPVNFRFGGAWFGRDRAEIHLIQRQDATQAPGDGLNQPTAQRNVTFARHLCFAITDADAAVADLREHQVPIAYGPRNRGDGATQIYLYDPDGHMIELICLQPAHVLPVVEEDWG